jgi:TorA maturation chaperone TorD
MAHTTASNAPDHLVSGEPVPQTTPASLHTLAGLYRFCSQSMRFPSSSWFNRDYLECLYQLLEGIGGIEKKTELQAVFAHFPAALEDLQIEYTRLFINGSPHVIAPPYASVYLDRSLQGKSTERILSFYIAKGFRMCENSDLPDHLVHQLEFLALLTEEGDGKSEDEFLSQFFFPWFTVFLERILTEARHPFYKTVVLLIDYFTKEEDEHGIQGLEA